MKQLLIATQNHGKLLEIQALLDDPEIHLLTPADRGISMQVDEDGTTYTENAGKKALAHAHMANLIALADDSGLEVDALDGKPGLHSARFSPKPGADDADRRAYLLHRLQGTPPPWPAHFHCTMAIALPGGECCFTEGNCYGEIISVERGQNGFGYDPLFLLPELGLTMAELSMEQKNRLSHRALAIKAALPFLKALFKA